MTHTPEILFPTRYRLQDKLGQGGMSIVYRATDCLTGVTVIHNGLGFDRSNAGQILLHGRRICFVDTYNLCSRSGSS